MSSTHMTALLDGCRTLAVALDADRGDYAGAEAATRQAADLGEVRAMDTLGGLAEARGDRAEALTWYAKAADAGLSGAVAARDRLTAGAAQSGEADEVSGSAS